MTPTSRAPPATTPPQIEKECKTHRVMVVREDGEYDSASDFDEDTLALYAARDGANSDFDK
jgi:hypothetical protein